MGKPGEVAYLGGDGDSCERVDTSQAFQSPNDFAIWSEFGSIFDVLVENSHSITGSFKAREVLAKDDVGKRIIEALRVQPFPVHRRPMFSLAIRSTLAQQKLQ